MRMVFGVVSLLIALAVAGTLGKKQLQAMGLIGERATRASNDADTDTKAVTDALLGAARDGAAPAPVEGTVPAQAQAIQGRVRDAAAAALQKGAERSNATQP